MSPVSLRAVRPLILVTNDDGFHAPGLHALTEAMERIGECWVVAPESEQSATSHALTLHKPLRHQVLGERRVALSGTPTDCVFFSVLHLLPRRPDLVVSGINRGANLADDVTYSGTVSAALEAAIMELPGIAFSLCLTRATGELPPDWSDTAAFARTLAVEVLRQGLPKDVYLNVNVPHRPRGELRGVRPTTLGHRLYDDRIVEKADPRGRPYYWIGGAADFLHRDLPGSDCNAVAEGYISVTPLHADPTWSDGLAMLRAWGIEKDSCP